MRLSRNNSWWIATVSLLVVVGVSSGESTPAADQAPDRSADDARRIIRMAIERGVPLYNRGEVEGCVAVYEVAAAAAGAILRDTPHAALAEGLRQSSAMGADLAEARERAWALRAALDQALTMLASAAPSADAAFAPILEAELPKGFAAPGPPGEVQVRHYPAARAALVQGDPRSRGAFMRLFTHIKKHDIAMTAPVEQQLNDNGREMTAMAFFYADPNLGTPGSDGEVQVIDIAPRTYLSVGMRGSADRVAVNDAMTMLRQWLNAQEQYVQDGPPRMLGYNSPFIPPAMRYWELQIPVTKSPSAAAENPKTK